MNIPTMRPRIVPNEEIEAMRRMMRFYRRMERENVERGNWRLSLHYDRAASNLGMRLYAIAHGDSE